MQKTLWALSSCAEGTASVLTSYVVGVLLEWDCTFLYFIFYQYAQISPPLTLLFNISKKQ